MSDNQMTTRIQNYLSGKLDDAQLEQFECEMLSDPALAHEVSIAQLMQFGIDETAIVNNVVEISSTRKIVRSAPRRPTWLPWTLAAAATITAVGLGLKTSQLQKTNKQMNAQIAALNAPRGNVIVQMLQVVRGIPPQTNLDTKGGKHDVLLIAPLLDDVGQAYQAILRDAANHEVWRVTNLRPDSQNLLTVLVPAKVLKPGQYQLELSAPLEPSAEVLRFGLVVE
jgi:hypothetical protein